MIDSKEEQDILWTVCERISKANTLNELWAVDAMLARYRVKWLDKEFDVVHELFEMRYRFLETYFPE